MTELLFPAFSVVVSLFGIEAALNLYIKKHRKEPLELLNKKVKTGLIGFPVILVLFLGYLYFFEETLSYLECQKETMTCTYFITTFSNQKNEKRQSL